jgi:SDR family mycofactocin-dependent oxidoreductase
MGKLDGKVAFITGAARGQGRSHAVKLASEGADIIAVDLCEQIATVEYPMSTAADLAETVRLVEALDRRIVATQADVRDLAALQAAVQQGEAALGPIDIIVANAGIAPLGLDGDPVQPFLDVVAVNLTGVYNTVIAAVPSLIAKQAGAIVLTSSTQGLKGTGGNGGAGGTGYAAAKHGVVGLMRSFANWLGPQNIRVNSIHPTGVATPMIQNAVMEKLFADNPDAGGDAVKNLMPVPWVEPIDISNAIAFLVSDDARYVTGVTFPVDAGFSVR